MAKKKQSPWFEFSQNNSGGSFEVNKMVCHRVYIQAKDAAEANRIAVDMGIYFDGCNTGMDCSCCGDRWCPASGDGANYPYSGKQMVVAKDRLCQHIDLRAKTLEDFLQTARGFWNALAGDKDQ